MFSGCPSGRCPLTDVSRDAASLSLADGFQINLRHEYSSREWALLNRFSGSEVKGQGCSEDKCIFAAEAFISTVWRRG